MVVECVEVHDTLREVTTITVDRNDKGDTLKVVQITDRDRLRDRSQLRDKSEKLIVKTDTVYIAVRDSVVVRDAANISHHTSAISHLLKWIFWIIIGLIALIITAKLCLHR